MKKSFIQYNFEMKKKIKNIESNVKDMHLVEIRRMEIVKAAVDLFVRKGFHKTTVREIAQRFGWVLKKNYTLERYIEIQKSSILSRILISPNTPS